MPDDTLAQRIRAKYPGSYDDLSDTALEASVKAKFPGVYDDIPTSTAERTWGDTASDVGTGLAKSVVGAAVNLGNLAHKIPGVSTAVDALYGTSGLSKQAFTEAQQAVQPTNAPQTIGKVVGDIGQVIVPGNAITRAGMRLAEMAPTGLKLASRIGAEAAGGGAISAAQGGDPTTGAILSGAIPVVGKAAGAVSSRLKMAVPKHVEKALGAQKEKYKAMAERITPGIIARRLGGSRESLQQQASEAAQEASQAIDTALTTEYGGKVFATQPIHEALEQAKSRYRNIITRTVQEAENTAPAATGVVTTASKAPPASFSQPDATPAELFRDVVSDARRQGFTGSTEELKTLFDDAVKDAREFATESADMYQRSPEGLLRAIARNGGLGTDKGLKGELRNLRAAGSKLGDKNILGAARTGSVGRVGRVFRSGGKSLDEMAQNLREDGFHDIAGPNDLLAAIDEAVIARSRPTAQKGLGNTLQMVGVRPGTKWWQSADEGFDVAAIESGETATAPLTRTVRQTIELDKRPIRQIQKLQDILTEHGDEMSVDQLVSVRRVWDDVVAQAGGYAHRAPGGIGLPLKDSTEMWAKRKATTAIRQLLDKEVPELSALNKEFSFWKSLDDVLTQTMKRTRPQGPGLKSIAAEGAGRLAGALNPAAGVVGTVSKVWVLGKLVKMADAAFSSPRWQFASARMKDDLADAIANGNLNKAASTLARILSVQGSKVPAAVGAQ